MANGPLKKPLNFAGNPDHVTSRLGLGPIRVKCVILIVGFTRRLFSSNNNFSVSAALAEVCVLLSVILVYYVI